MIRDSNEAGLGYHGLPCRKHVSERRLRRDDRRRTAWCSEAVPLPNSYTGPQEDFFVIDPKDLHRVDRESREKGLDVIGVFHSHPDCDAYFSKRDLEHSCPWYLVRRTIDKERAFRSRQ